MPPGSFAGTLLKVLQQSPMNLVSCPRPIVPKHVKTVDMLCWGVRGVLWWPMIRRCRVDALQTWLSVTA